MLTRLELIGFKSFADRTRFDFAPGITAIVGPNGSGKSNIVDAVRWILGEQSAKNLRGGEMTDVIFNGSTTRKSLGMAEVTMTFDNTRRQLSADSDEVQITRRVYRDGEGEYAINGRGARLKDVKELFLGSGAGHGAYSIIEQGRVDALLAASTKDRRSIFEEAAGISRFKAKKLESIRKLERVDADLLRVRDILGELEGQLRTLRLQAAKAQRFQEYTTRLRELRVAAGLAEYRQLSMQLDTEESALATLRLELSDATERAEAGEKRLQELTWELSRTEDALRHQEARLADARQQIATQESAAKSERAQTANLEAEVLRLAKQRADLGYRIKNLESESAVLATDLTQTAERAASEEARATAAADALAAVGSRIAELTRRSEADRELQFELVGRSAKFHSDADTNRAQAERFAGELSRKHAEAHRKAAKFDAIEAALRELSQSDADVRQRLDDARVSLAAHTAARDELRARADALQTDLESLRERRSALRGRADVLEGLERTFEGFGAGVRAVVQRIEAGEAAISRGILGLVADLLTVPRDLAPLVDLALGDAAQRFVTRDSTALGEVLEALGDLPGRVGFVPVQNGNPATTSAGSRTDPPPIPLSASVRCDLPGFAHQLLGNVVLAENLGVTRELAVEFPHLRFLTRAGELLEPDGSVTVGPPRTEAGILSRKSELRELRTQTAALDAEIRDTELSQAKLRKEADSHEVPIRAREEEIATLTGEAGTLRDQILEQRQVQRGLADDIDNLEREGRQLEAEMAKATAAAESAAEHAAAADREAADVKARLETAALDLAAAERDRDRKQQENTDAQVALSRVREQLAGLRKKRDDLDSDLKNRRIDGVNLFSAEKSARLRLAESRLATLRATSAAASAYFDKESRERNVASLAESRNQFRSARETVDLELKQLREAWKDQHSAAHAHELSASELRSRRDAIASRVREDYSLDLAELAATTEPTPVTEDSAQEITDLRRKLEKLGSVNLEALAELTEVEGRERELRSQHDDLADARRKLQTIIDEINTDSRKLFSETLTTIRGHFQELFRKLFAGGQADIVLEDETDVLESGIEITARPPGKELRKISLLSGGEKALTAVALLLAIFRSRPSPFCLLDEVDAAMDEANTQRLAQSLREFSDRSQFIVITHKKRTMAVADVLYGVTMQEGGVSRQVAVRFDDWPDEGEPLAKAA